MLELVGKFTVCNENFTNAECFWYSDGTYSVRYGDCFEQFVDDYDSVHELFMDWNVEDN